MKTWMFIALALTLGTNAQAKNSYVGNGGNQGDVELLWKLLENEPGTEITVDLESRTIAAKDVVARFQLDDYTRWRLLEGLDDISLTLRHEASITDFEGRRPGFLPTTVR